MSVYGYEYMSVDACTGPGPAFYTALYSTI